MNNKTIKCTLVAYDKPNRNGVIISKDVFEKALKDNPNMYVTTLDSDIYDDFEPVGIVTNVTCDEDKKEFIGEINLLENPGGRIISNLLESNEYEFTVRPYGSGTFNILEHTINEINIKEFVIGADKKLAAKWEISCDGYYPYCSNCYYEPNYGDKLSTTCPTCGANMINVDDNGEFIKQI